MSKGRVMHGGHFNPYPMPSLERAAREAVVDPSPSAESDDAQRIAYEEAFEQGERAGLAMGEEKALVLIEKLEKLTADIAVVRERLVRELEPQIVELAVVIAQKIILKEVDLHPEVLVEITKEALRRLERTGQITIKVNPSVHELFMKHRPELLSIHPDIVFDLDPGVSCRGSVVVGPAEDVVTDIDEQLNTLVAEIADTCQR